MDWDDLKIFLAVARMGSVRGAAVELDVNQSTVSRRIAAFEKSIGHQLFEKQPTGYLITSAGEEILANVERIEEEVSAISRQLFRRQPDLSGPLKVALPVPLAINFLMPEIARFTTKYPSIHLDLAVSSGNTNLSKREADIAIRIVKIGASPPPYLIGRKLVTYATATYVARERQGKNNLWVGINDTEQQPDWLTDSDFANTPIGHTVDELVSQVQAVKAGMGMAVLPCCLADTHSSLVRVNPGKTMQGREIWLLTHPDLKDTPRVRIFLDFIREFFEQNKALIEGHQANP